MKNNVSAASKDIVLNLHIIKVKKFNMIIPVVTKDIMYFSKLKSKININKYSLVQIKNRKEMEDLIK